MSRSRPTLQCEGPGCQEMFVPARADGRFHSDACRKMAARQANVDPNTGEVLKFAHKRNQRVVGIDKGDPDGDYSIETVFEGNTMVSQKVTKPSSTLVDASYDREYHLGRFIEMGVAKVNWLSTGIPEFDELTKIPRGRVTQIQGRYGAGKTTLCLNMIKGQKGIRTLYIDAEAALNPDLLVELGLDSGDFVLYNDSSYIEDIMPVIRKAAKSGEFDLIVLDSVPMTTTKTIDESDVTARNIGQKAFFYHKLCELIAMDLKATDTAMVFINQVRDVIGSYTPQTYTPGGTGVLYQASLIVQLKTIPSWRFPKSPKNGLYEGQEVEATVIKSKVNVPHRIKKFKLYYPQPYVESEA